MRRSIRGTLALSGLALLSSSVVGLLQDPQEPRAQEEMSLPAFDEAGELVRPTGWEKWTLVGSSLGLGYSDRARGEGLGTFKHVYTQPEAFESYRKTGKFPEGAMFALVIRKPEERKSIAQGGYVQGELTALEFSVKDSKQFEEGWAYFGLSGKDGLLESAPPFEKEHCYSCHAQHAKDDNVFVQFYPRLRRATNGQ